MTKDTVNISISSTCVSGALVINYWNTYNALQPLFGFLKGLRLLAVNFAQRYCQLFCKTCRNQSGQEMHISLQHSWKPLGAMPHYTSAQAGSRQRNESAMYFALQPHGRHAKRQAERPTFHLIAPSGKRHYSWGILQCAKRFHNAWADWDGERAQICQVEGLNHHFTHMPLEATTHSRVVGLPLLLCAKGAQDC